MSDADLNLMRRSEELHLELPFAGVRRLRDLLRGAKVSGSATSTRPRRRVNDDHGILRRPSLFKRKCPSVPVLAKWVFMGEGRCLCMKDVDDGTRTA